MIDKDLYRETFSRLCASDEAKKEVFRKMEKQKKIRFPKLLRGAAIAAVMTMALAVTAGAVNVATDGMLLDGTLFRIIFFDGNHMELEDGQGNHLSVTAVDGQLVREEDGRVYVSLDGEDTDITVPLLENGVYSFEYEVSASAGDEPSEASVVAVEVSGAPGDLIVTQKSLNGDDAVVYSVSDGSIVGGTDDPETFAAITEGRMTGDGEVFVTASAFSYDGETLSPVNPDTEAASSSAASVD